MIKMMPFRKIKWILLKSTNIRNIRQGNYASFCFVNSPVNRCFKSYCGVKLMITYAAFVLSAFVVIVFGRILNFFVPYSF
jgi:hypothetical protein